MCKNINCPLVIIAIILYYCMAINLGGAEGANKIQYYSVPSFNNTTGLKDSCLAGEAVFDVLPEYLKPGRISISYWVQNDMDKDIIFYAGNEHSGEVRMDNPVIIAKGPFNKGDTVNVGFNITPMKINSTQLSIAVMENDPPFGTAMRVPRRKLAFINLSYNINTLGKTELLGLSAEKEGSNMYLGPSTEIAATGIYFTSTCSRRPGFDLNYQSTDLEYRLSESFQLDGLVIPTTDDSGYFRINWEITPCRNYPYGLESEISFSNGIKLYELSRVIGDRADSGMSQSCSYAVKAIAPGLHMIRFNFLTLNPNFDTSRSNTHKNMNAVISVYKDIYMGIDEILHPQFFIDYCPDLENINKYMSIYTAADPRYSMMSGANLPRLINSIKSDNFDRYIGFGNGAR